MFKLISTVFPEIIAVMLVNNFRSLKKFPRALLACSHVFSCLFLPQTPHGELAVRLKTAEKELFKLCGTKVKIVERAGMGLKTVLVSPNPWAKQDCGRKHCLPCQDEKNIGMCKKRSITYETRCKFCHTQGKDKIYIGESARSSYATRAAGGIIYSLSVLFLIIFGKAVRTHYCKYLYSVKSGWSEITLRLTQNIYLKTLYSRITL